MRTKALLLAVSLFAFFGLQAQTQGYLEGKVLLEMDSSAIFMAHVRAFQGTNLVNGAVTEEDGSFKIKALSPGKYKVIVSYVGYGKKTILAVEITSNQPTDLGPVTLSNSLKPVEIIYHPKLIDKGGGMIYRMTPGEVGSLPNPTNIIENLQVFSSEFQVSGSGEIHFRGSRDGETAFYVDGVRVDDPNGIPRFAMGSMKVYAGGVPAQYGDFTGGVVVVETKSYFDWEQEQRSLIKKLNENRAPKTIAVEKEEDAEIAVSKRELRKQRRLERKAARKARKAAKKK